MVNLQQYQWADADACHKVLRTKMAWQMSPEGKNQKCNF
jgi:hypothetical protein